MGLDIYLSGRITIAPRHNEYRADGTEVDEIRVKLGYWRKDWFLQNYMLSRYPDEASGYEWTFGPEGLRELLGEIQSGVLNDKSITLEDGDYPQEDLDRTILILQHAIKWLEECPTTEWRDVIYRASW